MPQRKSKRINRDQNFGPRRHTRRRSYRRDGSTADLLNHLVGNKKLID